MIPDLKSRLYEYVAGFNADDEEIHPTLIPNRDAYDYLSSRVPLLECPDKTIEKTYYFRWWTLRKHWKDTPDGHILTEFLPPVGWAGPHNSINCPAGHHIMESRWLRDPEGWLKEYIRFWLDKKGNTLAYSAWYASAVEDMLRLHPDPVFEAYCLDRLIPLFREREAISLHSSGLFWSEDGWDGGECSISGKPADDSRTYAYADRRVQLCLPQHERQKNDRSHAAAQAGLTAAITQKRRTT